MLMNVYDFDNTIYRGDSAYRFFMFELLRRPKVLLYVPEIALAAISYYVFHIGTKTRFKEKMYRYLKVCDTERDVRAFWKKNINRIKPFYKDIHKDDDVIISASAEFLLKPLEDELGFTVLASRVSPSNGKTLGNNCYHEEKVRRFLELRPDGKIDSFYSDSYADEPLARLADKAYMVRGEDISPWNFERHKRRLRT